MMACEQWAEWRGWGWRWRRQRGAASVRYPFGEGAHAALAAAVLEAAVVGALGRRLRRRALLGGVRVLLFRC